jgi:kynurenine formamidase
MRRTLSLVLLMVIVACASVAQDKWYPSRWGAEDQRGAANRITPAKVLEAKNLITRGQTYQLGHVYEAAMPLFGTRHYSLRIPESVRAERHEPDVLPRRNHQRRVGTDRHAVRWPGACRHRRSVLQREQGSEFAKAEGLTKLGIENVGALVTRGVLIDVAAYKSQAMLAGGYEITRADIEGTLKRQNVAIRSGDVVIFHTGWGSQWIKDNAKFNANAPGIGLEAAQYLVDHEIVVAGSDTWSVEVVPNPNAALAFPVHQVFIAKNGILYFREPRDRGTVARRRVRIRVHVCAAATQGRDRIARQSAGNPVVGLSSLSFFVAIFPS